LFAVSILFAADNRKSENLGFSQGDKEFAIGILAGWDASFGFPFVWDIGAVDGMLSFGGEFRLWWGRYYDYWRQYTKFGWSPTFRAMFHPFGIPALRGQVKVAKVLDPYAGVKFGFSVINYDKDDLRRQGNYHRDVDFPAFAGVAGLRWYFKEKVSLWTEFATYDYSLGFSFKF
jgi:hypothetical protein